MVCFGLSINTLKIPWQLLQRHLRRHREKPNGFGSRRIGPWQTAFGLGPLFRCSFLIFGGGYLESHINNINIIYIYTLYHIVTYLYMTYLYIYMIYGHRQNYGKKQNVQLRRAAPASDFSIIGFFPIRVQNIPEVIRTFFCFHNSWRWPLFP